MCQALSQRRQALWQGPLEPESGRGWPAHLLLWSVEQRVQQVQLICNAIAALHCVLKVVVSMPPALGCLVMVF